jgi:hypothetical protein
MAQTVNKFTLCAGMARRVFTVKDDRDFEIRVGFGLTQGSRKSLSERGNS